MSAQMIFFAMFAIGATVTYPGEVVQIIALWLAIAVARYVW